MGHKPWDSYQEWHDLLDAVCIDQGHNDNIELASKLSAVSGNRSSEAFETALKNLRNWRSGSNRPQRRNFIFLTRMLHVDSHEGLQEQWIALYAKTQKHESNKAEARPEATEELPQPPKTRMPFAMVATALFLLAAGGIYFSQTGFKVFAENIRSADVEYRKAVSLKIGEQIVVHGARGGCGEEPPSWKKVVAKLPELEIGHWSDGDIGSRYSRKCGGPTLARGVVFNATKSGSAEIKIYGDTVKIEVR